MTDGQDRVQDDEQLYRRVLDSSMYSTDGGQLRFSSTAFNDRSRQPSVDRAKIQNFDPHRSRITTTDGIIELNAAKVRAIGPIVQQNTPPARPSSHVVDVTPDTVNGDISLAIKANPAHALIITQPPLTGSSAFKRFKESLAKLATEAGWCIEPGAPLPRHELFIGLRKFFRWILQGLGQK